MPALIELAAVDSGGGGGTLVPAHKPPEYRVHGRWLLIALCIALHILRQTPGQRCTTTYCSASFLVLLFHPPSDCVYVWVVSLRYRQQQPAGSRLAYGRLVTELSRRWSCLLVLPALAHSSASVGCPHPIACRLVSGAAVEMS